MDQKGLKQRKNSVFVPIVTLASPNPFLFARPAVKNCSSAVSVERFCQDKPWFAPTAGQNLNNCA
jgi:hypothetical protein